MHNNGNPQDPTKEGGTRRKMRQRAFLFGGVIALLAGITIGAGIANAAPSSTTVSKAKSTSTVTVKPKAAKAPKANAAAADPKVNFDSATFDNGTVSAKFSGSGFVPNGEGADVVIFDHTCAQDPGDTDCEQYSGSADTKGKFSITLPFSAANCPGSADWTSQGPQGLDSLGGGTLTWACGTSISKPMGGFTTAVNGNTVTVTDTSSGGTSVSYDYGDGTPATADTTHTYASSTTDQTYTVTQTVTNSAGTATTTHEVTVKGTPAPPSSSTPVPPISSTPVPPSSSVPVPPTTTVPVPPTTTVPVPPVTTPPVPPTKTSTAVVPPKHHKSLTPVSCGGTLVNGQCVTAPAGNTGDKDVAAPQTGNSSFRIPTWAWIVDTAGFGLFGFIVYRRWSAV